MSYYLINEDGEAREVNFTDRYLVTYRIEGELVDPQIETARQIFEKIDMNDCYDISINRLYLLNKEKAPTQCYLRGCWHNPKDPLRMEIRNLVTDEVYSFGYGTDH